MHLSRRRLVGLLCLGVCCGVALRASALRAMQDRAATRSPIVVASKPFTESYLLAEMVAQLLERRGLAVERRIGLGATDVAFAAIRRGDIDVYPEYTGTGLQVLLGDSATGLSAAETYRRVAAGSVRAFDVTWLPPLGFENTYAIAVSRRTAERLRLRTLADLGRPDVALRAGLTPDFIGRADGLPRLQQVTGWTPRETRPLSAVVKYSALRSASVDVIDAYSTDGRLAGDSLVVLTDNVSAFPPYEASLVVSARLRDTQPHVIALLTQLSGMIDEGAMRRCNAALELEGAELRRTAARALDELALPRGQGDAARQMLRPPRAGLLDAAWWADMPRWLGRHFFLALTALTLAVIVGGTFGTWLALSARRADLLLRLLGAIQTIPGIALLVLCIPLFGIGAPPAIFALWLYALLPIVQGVYTGLRFTDRATLQASVALGLSPWQQLRDVRIPLAAPALISALRTASVLTVGGATLAAFVGGGGLGEPIATGLSLADQRLVLAGAIPSALLAILLDLLLAGLARLVTPAHLR